MFDCNPSQFCCCDVDWRPRTQPRIVGKHLGARSQGNKAFHSSDILRLHSHSTFFQKITLDHAYGRQESLIQQLVHTLSHHVRPELSEALLQSFRNRPTCRPSRHKIGIEFAQLLRGVQLLWAAGQQHVAVRRFIQPGGIVFCDGCMSCGAALGH